jgi:hypothetical protein
VFLFCGAISHYENKKTFINLYSHKTDFGIEAERHFFATSHEKGPCDGVGDNIKHPAACVSLQNPKYNLILTPLDLRSWAQKNFRSILRTYN